MSAAPSSLSWEEWSASFLDQENPVVYGRDKCSIPEFWKGSALVWSHCPAAKSSSAASLAVIHPGHQIVCNSNDDDVYSVGGVNQKDVQNKGREVESCRLICHVHNTACNLARRVYIIILLYFYIDPLKVHKLIEDYAGCIICAYMHH